DEILQKRDRIKKMEYQAKQSIKGLFVSNRNILESYEKAKGFYSYYLTFKTLFCPNSNHDTVKHVLISFESIANLAQQRINKIKHTISTFLTLLAIFISSNILVQNENFGFKKFFDENSSLLDFNIKLFIILLIIFIAIDFVTSQYIPSFFLSKLPKLKKWIDKNEAQLIQFYQNKPQSSTIPIFFSALIISMISIVIGIFLLFIGLSS
ncbi:MAG: hypothetical protein DSY46_03445, partial [Hydrogenimonas sp.]